MSHDDLPSLRDELDRKALEFLIDTEQRVQGGLMSKGAAALRAQATWAITAGLVSESVSEAAEMAVSTYGTYIERHVFVGNGEVLLLTIDPNALRVKLLRVNPETSGAEKLQDRSFESGDDLAHFLARLRSGLKDKRYVCLTQ